jgi:CRISPR-associated protein Cst2
MVWNYIRITGRFTIEVSVLTGSDTIGNYNTHATAKIVISDKNGSYKSYEVPVITGNMLKHWHAVYLAKTYEALGGQQLNELCKKGIGLRGYKLEKEKMEYADSESDAIKDLCNDIHGFLIPDKQLKRDSLVKFSFGIPILNEKVLENVSRFTTLHNRVDPVRRENTEMMIFKQEYSTAPLYGFAITMDLAYVMTPIYEITQNKNQQQEKTDEEEKNRRKKAAVLALLYMFNGVGSKQARALPIIEVKELLIAVSNVPIPNLVNGAYEDYIDKSLQIIEAFKKIIGNDRVKLYGYGIDKKYCNKIECKDSLDELFDIIINT